MPTEITVEQTTDEPYIKSVFLNPAIYGSMKDDSCPESPMILQGVDIKAVPGFFLKACVDGVPAGAWWFVWKGENVEAHTALLENCRGRDAIRAGRMAIAWVWQHTGAKAIQSYAWSDAPAVHWFCRAVGLKAGDTAPWPNTRNGATVDITHFSISRPTETK